MDMENQVLEVLAEGCDASEEIAGCCSGASTKK